MHRTMKDIESNCVYRWYFKSSVADAISRNSQRSDAECVLAPAMLGTNKKLKLPMLSEGFDELWYVRIDENTDFIAEGYRSVVSPPAKPALSALPDFSQVHGEV